MRSRCTTVICTLFVTLTGLSLSNVAGFVVKVDVSGAGDGSSLLAARNIVRQELTRRREEAELGSTENFDNIEVHLAGGRHSVPAGGLLLDGQDSGRPNDFQVIWRTDPTASEPAILSGGVNVSGWQKLNSTQTGFDLWAANAPPSLTNATSLPSRDLFVGGVRYNRTTITAEEINITASDGAQITPNGYLTSSSIPALWQDPTSAEIVADFTWVQHRCAITSVQNVEDEDVRVSECAWGTKLPGTSPGSSIEQISAESWEDCQAACCNLESKCKGIIFHPPSPSQNGSCYLTDRTVEGNYEPGSAGFVADMNGPPPPKMRSRINVSQACWDTARVSGYGQVTYPTFIENSGTFSRPGEWWLDRTNGLIFISTDENSSTPLDGVASIEESLLQLVGAHDVALVNITYEHTTWLQPNREQGYVERYGNVYFADPEKVALRDPLAAVTINNGHGIDIENCTFQHTGAWALALNNASQNVTVRDCTLWDLGGGGIMIGDVNMTSNITDPALQMAGIHVEDNEIVRVGVEFHGAPGIHSFCMRDSSIEHNTIRDVSYTGISYNWPNPQGPTTGDQGDSPVQGYSANNIVSFNDVSLFMRYMNDGGGIHTIGRSRNTSINGNYFHDLAAGNSGEVSQFAQSTIYIDNWSCGLNITNNVVDNCPGVRQGYYFFQGHTGNNGLAHDNEIIELAVREGGQLSGMSVACNCSGVTIVDKDEPLPAWANDVVANAGRRK